MREEEFKNKRILFVSPPFFNYYKYISDELTSIRRRSSLVTIVSLET